MKIDEYQRRALMTAIYDYDTWGVLYPALGLASEAGEVAGKVKKVIRDGNGVFSDEMKEAIAKELGDVMWYCAAVAEDLGYDLSVILEENLEKLESRMQRGVIGGSGDKR